MATIFNMHAIEYPTKTTNQMFTFLLKQLKINCTANNVNKNHKGKFPAREPLSNIDLINHYSDTVTEMKNRGIIHSNNVLGDLGEYFAIEYYTNTLGLPKLQ